ncbi:hypothetical protein EGJ48_08345 [Pantoea dispersa]|nr:hypothetical protein EGJ48_08345 [Pantoea dispersa]
MGYLAIDQIAQSGLSSLKVIYYSAQLFSNEPDKNGYYPTLKPTSWAVSFFKLTIDRQPNIQ